MDRQSNNRECERGLDSWRFIIVLLIIVSVIAAAIILSKNRINTYELTPLSLISDTKFLIKSHNDGLGQSKINLSATEDNTQYLDMEIKKDKIMNATFYKVNISKGFELFLDTNIIDLKIKNYDTAKAYAIDPVGIDFENATFIINATGRQLFKCAMYDFADQDCYGEWKKIMDLIPGKNYELLITKEDPAFIETNQSEFDLGIYNRTLYNSSIGAVQLNASYYNGSYLSKVFDASGLAKWVNISWTEGAPYGEELPDSQRIENILSGANMTGNALMLHLNDGNGASVFKDTSGNQKNGSCGGADCPTWTSNGKFGGAYSFDGNDRIGTQVTTAFNDFSVEVWFKDNGDNVQYERLADKSYTMCFWLGRNSNTPNSWGGGVRETSSPYGVFVTLQDGQWHQIVSIRRGTTHYIYGDGGKVVSSNTVSNTACDATAFAVGAYGDIASTQQRFTGLIDEVSFYNRSLSAQEVLDHYKRGAAKLNLTVRSCDDNICDGDAWNTTYENSSTQRLNAIDNRYFQYKGDFFTNDTTIRPELYSVTIGYDILDNIAPRIYLEFPANWTVNSTDKTPDFRFNATDETAHSLNCSLWMNATIGGIAGIKATNSSIINGTSATLTPTIPLSNNLYWWWVSCSDGFNINTSVKRIINISVGDIDAPTISLVSPGNNTINTTDNTPEFRFIPRDDIADTLSCTLWLKDILSGISLPYGNNPSINNGTVAAIAANTSLSNKNYTWWVSCSDGANSNISAPWMIQIYVDVNAPAVTLNSPSLNSKNTDFSSVSFTCSASDDIFLKNISLYSDYNGNWQFIEGKNISGANGSATFYRNILKNNQFVNNYFTWNCLAYDNTSKQSWNAVNYTFSNWDLGTHSNTVYNTELNSITLNNYNSGGIYTSKIFDAGSIVGWKNISWQSNALSTETQLNYFNNAESKGYYSEVTYSVRHWYNISNISSPFSRIKISSVLDCDGSCSGTIDIRIGNSTHWTDYAFLNAASIRTDGTTTDYTWYNNTYNISREELGDYFFVQLLLYTGSGTVNFLMDETGPLGPDPEYRSGGNGDGSQAGWANDNGDYALKINMLQDTELNLRARSCDDPNCNYDPWSDPIVNSTYSSLQVPNNRYFQYQADMQSIGSLSTPKLYNVTINYGPADDTPPSIALLSPADNSGDEGYMTTLYYSVNDDNLIDSCELLFNNAVLVTDNSIVKGVNQEFNLYEISVGTYYWHINCTDINGNENSSQVRKLTIIPKNEYTGTTTNLSQVNVENITHLILEKPGFGLINFSDSINLSGGADINSFVEIANNLISIDSGNLPQLNKSAILTLYNLTIINPVIVKDNASCPDCNILGYNGNLTFSVQHFSSYSASENSRLEIWDDTDAERKTKMQIIKFYANYSNTTGRGPVISAICNITFSDTGISSMIYNSSNLLHEYNRSFSSAGIYYYTVSCIGPGYTSLNTTDYTSINELSGPEGANITIGTSERGNINIPPGSGNAGGGNVTAIILNTTTISKSWQGYYGNITGRILLQGPGSSMLYDWEINNPNGEVYATRAIDINFATVNCTNLTEIAAEEAYLGQIQAEGDSVTNTFNKISHPSINIGSFNIPADICRSTNLYINNKTQATGFFEILLSDDASNLVYTSIINANHPGFDGRLYDFQMIVGQNGHGNNARTTKYYFFMEIS